MSIEQQTGDTDVNGSPTIDSTDIDNQSDSGEAGNDKHDPYEKYGDAHGTIRDDGSPLVDGQFYPSTIEEHMRLIKKRANSDDHSNG